MSIRLYYDNMTEMNNIAIVILKNNMDCIFNLIVWDTIGHMKNCCTLLTRPLRSSSAVGCVIHCLVRCGMLRFLLALSLFRRFVLHSWFLFFVIVKIKIGKDDTNTNQSSLHNIIKFDQYYQYIMLLFLIINIIYWRPYIQPIAIFHEQWWQQIGFLFFIKTFSLQVR